MIQYIYERYGRHRAGLAATVICYRARSAIREVGKVFGLSDDTVGALAGMLWGWSTQAVSEKDARRVGLDPADPHLARGLALARELIGFPRHLSQHVGGFVITRGRLDEVVPIENAAMEERTCVEWDKDDLDAIGILKIDVLGLGMLSCLQRGFDLLNKHYARLPPPPAAGLSGETFSVATEASGDLRRLHFRVVVPHFDLRSLPFATVLLSDEVDCIHRKLQFGFRRLVCVAVELSPDSPAPAGEGGEGEAAGTAPVKAAPSPFSTTGLPLPLAG